MRRYVVLLLCTASFALQGQDSWKNVYSRHAWDARDKWQKPEALIGFLNISQGSRVADIGSHEGYMTFKLAEAVTSSGTVYAVDLDASKLQKVKEHAAAARLSQIKTVRGEEDDPKLAPASVDAILILDTYHEIKQPARMLQHLKLALREGGRLVICEPIAASRRNASRADQQKRHELAMAFAIADVRKAGFSIHYEKDPFVDRTAEKGDMMWVVVALKD